MAGASGRVLVVDDNRVIRQLIRVNLELEGFEVVTAADGAECLEIVHSVQPDVVTLDVVMPRLDGARTAACLRADARTRRIGIVMVSAGSLPESVAGPGGVDAFVAKPFEPALLVEKVRALIGRSRSREQSADGGGGGNVAEARTDRSQLSGPGHPGGRFSGRPDAEHAPARPLDQPSDRPAGIPLDNPAGSALDHPADPSAERPAAPSPDRPHDQAAAAPGSGTTTG